MLIMIMFLTSCSQKGGHVLSEKEKQGLPSPNYLTDKKASQKDTNNNQTDKDNQQSVRNLSDYFPMDIGREWAYDIKLGKVAPMLLEDVIIVNNNEPYNFSLVGPINANNAESYSLRMQIVEPKLEQVPSGAVEVKILQDELGLYRFVDSIFWHKESLSISGSQSGVLQSYMYSVPELMAVYPYSQLKDASSVHSNRNIFIWGGGGIVSDDKEESFFFIGMDNSISGWQGIQLAHFTRKANSDESSGSKSITENYWYAPNKGLVRLEQTVEGEISMTWTLK